MNTIKIAITDDHIMFADGIANIIAANPDWSLAFIASNTEEMMSRLATEAVDILILDINIPPHNGLVLLPEIQKRFPLLKVMILSMFQPDDVRLVMDDFSGDAYVLKTSGKQVLEKALQHLANNEKFTDPNIVYHPLSAIKQEELKLTKREKEIIALIAAGMRTKEIAAKLYLSELTIQTHRKNISEKLGVKGVAELIKKSIDITKDKA